MNNQIVNKKVLSENEIVGNKKLILNTLGFKSINAAKKKYNLRRNEIENSAMCNLLLINYNDDVREFNRKNLQKILRAKKRKDKRKTIGLFNKLTNYVVKQEVKKEKSKKDIVLDKANALQGYAVSKVIQNTNNYPLTEGFNLTYKFIPFLRKSIQELGNINIEL